MAESGSRSRQMMSRNGVTDRGTRPSALVLSTAAVSLFSCCPSRFFIVPTNLFVAEANQASGELKGQ
ncbi:hypothetical protein VZT92_014708 [Zoarces viviparus]|uniref:Uncharacterized protein n=1 Tax=Zoarces viviparus TaxID=48416 RepID=A0AAW1F228_ZOAVI